MIFGYARVSTQSQNLDRQIDVLKTYGGPDERLVVEKISGTTKDRPELTKLQQFLRDGDLLVIESLSRLGRSTKDLLAIIDHFEKQGVQVVSIKEQIDTRTPTGKLLTTVLMAMCQFERDIIVQRTQEGLTAARARGRKGGRPPLSQAQKKQALALYDSKQMSIKEICSATRMSQSSLYNVVRGRSTLE
ncbi:recombinase family protein [Candidatus Saccharibacteria bacterium]|nr:recombinase family protein [Candidatus Saccharibacteria bacterium]